jgi:NAD(P)-dependent dehydrogenase (short-subunit alcohol dehydrogenase family)
MDENVDGTGRKIALVTGANKGIGFGVSRRLGHAGLTVILGVRDIALGEAASTRLRDEGLDVRPIMLDLTRTATIEAAVAAIAADFGHLDVLVNNAGISLGRTDGPPGSADIGAVRRIIETNFLGTLAVTQAMLPLLRWAEAARIVNVSSGLGSLTLNGDPDWQFAQVKLLGYNASKAALNMLTVQLAYELRDTPIKVNSADPGFTATDLNDHRGHQTIEEGASAPVRLALLPADGPSGGFFDAAGPQPW